MRNVIILLLIIAPFFAEAQCVQWIGGTTADAKALLPTIQEKLIFKLLPTKDSLKTNTLKYYDKEQYCAYKITSVVKNQLQGTTLIKLPPTVTNLYISGPADRIDQLFEMLKAQLATCKKYDAATNWVKFEGRIMLRTGIDSKNGVALKSITIGNE